MSKIDHYYQQYAFKMDAQAAAMMVIAELLCEIADHLKPAEAEFIGAPEQAEEVPAPYEGPKLDHKYSKKRY